MPFVRLNLLHLRLLIITLMEVVADQWELGYLHRSNCAVTEREELEVEVWARPERTEYTKATWQCWACPRSKCHVSDWESNVLGIA
jgi:hypothetical protein